MARRLKGNASPDLLEYALLIALIALVSVGLASREPGVFEILFGWIN